MFRDDISGCGEKNVMKGAANKAFSQATVDEKLHHARGDGEQDLGYTENSKLT